jgi:predicted permease
VTLLLNIFVNNILPVFIVVGIGALLSVTLRPDIKSLTRITFYVLGPCLIFGGLTRTPLSGNEVQQLMLFALIVQLSVTALAWLIVTLLRWESTRKRALLLSVLVVNAGNFGLSVVLFAFGPDAQARAMVYFVATAVLGNILGTIVAAGGGSWKQTLTRVARVPMVYATIAALIVNNFDQFQVPELLMRPISLLGGAAVPAMLLILGMQLAHSVGALRANVGAIGLATAMRLIVAPLIGVLVAQIMQLQGVTRQVCLIQSGMPSGVTSTILALEYDLAPEIVTSTVFFSTLCSALTLSVLISLIR